MTQLRFFIEAAFKREQQMCNEEGITIALKFQAGSGLGQDHIVFKQMNEVGGRNQIVRSPFASKKLLVTCRKNV